MGITRTRTNIHILVHVHVYIYTQCQCGVPQVLAEVKFQDAAPSLLTRVTLRARESKGENFSRRWTMVMGGRYTCTPGRRARRQGTPFGRQPNRCPSFAPRLADSPAEGEVCVCHRSAGESDARLIEWSSRDKFWRGMAVRWLRPVDFCDVLCEEKILL